MATKRRQCAVCLQNCLAQVTEEVQDFGGMLRAGTVEETCGADNLRGKGGGGMTLPHSMSDRMSSASWATAFQGHSNCQTD